MAHETLKQVAAGRLKSDLADIGKIVSYVDGAEGALLKLLAGSAVANAEAEGEMESDEGLKQVAVGRLKSDLAEIGKAADGVRGEHGQMLKLLAASATANAAILTDGALPASLAPKAGAPTKAQLETLADGRRKAARKRKAAEKPKQPARTATKAQLEALARGRKLIADQRRQEKEERERKAEAARPAEEKRHERRIIALAKKRGEWLKVVRKPASGDNPHQKHATLGIEMICDGKKGVQMFGNTTHMHFKFCDVCRGAYLGGMVKDPQARGSKGKKKRARELQTA